jgi:predicted ATP-grasp superfamily ATP-dependent carboligase
MSHVEWFRHPELREPRAVVAFSGWGDAGQASTGAVEHLIASIEGDAFALIDPDDFYDFQNQRPLVEFLDSGVRALNWPRNEFHALHQRERDLVAVLGVEPQLRWRGFSDAIADVLVGSGVERVVLLGAFLGQVPHTVPVPLIGSSPNPLVMDQNGVQTTRYEGPTGIVGVLTQHLAERGLETMSLWAAVPHYLGSSDYPPATYALVRKAASVLGLSIDTTDLAAAAVEFRLSVDSALESNEELGQYVRKLEAALTESAAVGPDRSVAASLVDEIERFLKNR